MTTSFYWHDYETFGADPQRDQACQFAGQRTDLDLNPVGEPLVIYCQPHPDRLPHPEACLITGITPQHAREHGVNEAEFIRRIHAELSAPETCGLGYNSLRFDDEVTRNLLYRNFFDPYAREWQNQNSRWDLIDLTRAAHALRPDGMIWPQDADGAPCFRLSELTAANGLAHAAAHDALSDVHASIALARLLKQRQPKLFDYLFQNRGKHAAQQLLNLGGFTPLVHVSGRYPAKKHCLAIVVALAAHPVNANETIVYDLSQDPTPLLTLEAEEIRVRLFTASAELPPDAPRIPLKTVHHNKCPVLAPLSVIRKADAERLSLDLKQCDAHLQALKSAADLPAKLSLVFTRDYQDAPADPDLMIYSGGFFNQHDKAILNRIRDASPEQLARLKPAADDPRLPDMLFRYRARNYPHSLSQDEQQEWRDFCRQRLQNPEDPRRLSLAQYHALLDQLERQAETDKTVLESLRAYAGELRGQLEINPI